MKPDMPEPIRRVLTAHGVSAGVPTEHPVKGGVVFDVDGRRLILQKRRGGKVSFVAGGIGISGSPKAIAKQLDEILREGKVKFYQATPRCFCSIRDHWSIKGKVGLWKMVRPFERGQKLKDGEIVASVACWAWGPRESKERTPMVFVRSEAATKILKQVTAFVASLEGVTKKGLAEKVLGIIGQHEWDLHFERMREGKEQPANSLMS